MVRLTLETNTFCDRRIHVHMKRGFVWNNCRQGFPGNNFLQFYSFLCRKSVYFFPIVQFNWVSYFGEISTQLNIHYWGNGPAIFLTKKTVSGM